MRQCPDCGEELSYDSEFCPQCGAETDFFMKPAGFWIRFGAIILDWLIFAIPFVILEFILKRINIDYVLSVTYVVLKTIPDLFYKPLMESIWGATLGKMICKIQVLDGEGKKLPISRAYLRFFPFLLYILTGLVLGIWIYSQPDLDLQDPNLLKTLMQNPTYLLLTFVLILTVLFLFVDCLCVAFNPRKRAIHDMMAGSFCVKKPEAELLPAATDIPGPDDKLPMKF